MHVVIPYTGGCQHRERALRWVTARYRESFPDWTIVIAHYGKRGVKASAVMPAVKRCRSDLVLVADADCWTDGIARAVAMVEEGAPWAVPHGQVFRLTKEGTDALLAGESWDQQELDRPPYVGYEGGGITIAPRKTLLSVPMDEHFDGWGQEDQSWGLALNALAGGSWRGSTPLIHLWHPPQQRMTRKWGSVASRERYRLYMAARRNPHKMRELLQEYR